MEYVIYSDGIKCAGCASTIKDVLGNLSGVHSVSVDIDSRRITIEADDHMRCQIVTTLFASGYPEKIRS